MSILSEFMLRRIEIFGLSPDLFSTNSDDGWIHAVLRKHMFRIYQRNREGLDAIGIYLSGWYKKYSKEWPFYLVPYWLHRASQK
ncbi:unnamed protein product [Blepharisma stoltei]|uniref:Uncharacterized protein n=1 Tax=Blepharisma stoltei TaxID=1481888 RepID=A0AAU9JKQ8_9CILI|nr:unnamed protein product [Blepharisma stoltei]